MFCSHCNAKVESNFNFCSTCGAELHLSTSEPSLVNSFDSETPPPDSAEEQIVKKKPMPFWFKLVSFLAVLALIGVTAGILFTESLVDVVDHQLEALRQDDLSKAYLYTSKDFQAVTSPQQFEKFIAAYPVFLTNQSAHFTQRAIEHNIGILKGKLTSQEHINTPIEYRLIKEDGKWKILSIRLLKPENIKNAQEADHTEELIETAKGQLKEIQDQKLTEAYQNFSSQEFRTATSEQAFKEFIKKYPILTSYHVVSFHKPTIRNGVGTISVILQSDQIAAYVKYYLIYENQKWKIWSMRILSPTEGEENQQEKVPTPDSIVPSMSFGVISLGDAVNAHGQIEHPQTVFRPDLKDLYVDIEVKEGRKGNVVYLNLQHLESGSSIPAKAVIEESGDSILMSVFSSPNNGWPQGKYQLSITTSSGLNDVLHFSIEE